MTLDVQTETRDGYLLVRVSGKHNVDIAKRMFGGIVDQCQQQALTGILFDVRELAGDISLADRYTFGEFLGSVQPRTLRIAILANEQHFWPDKFLETVAVNRGGIVRTTTDFDEAHAWLLRQ